MDKARELILAGVPISVVAAKTGLSVAQVEALADAEAGLSFERARALELQRLDRLHAAVWARAVKGDLAAVDRLLRISDRRMSLLQAVEPRRESPEPVKMLRLPRGGA